MPTTTRATNSGGDSQPLLKVWRNFPYGVAALSFLLLALCSGAYIAAHPAPKKTANLTFWTFAKPHYEAYLKAIPEFERAHPGVKVDVQLVSGDAVTKRLRAAFWADLDVPDLVECEISQAGTFFRGSVDHIGFADLTDRINRDGLRQKMVETRFAPYTTRGHVFGLPHDVHPVMLAYRRDIFAKNGIKIEDLKTWDDFVAAGRKVTIQGQQYMLEADENGGGGALEAMLFQRGGAYFDANGNCTFDNEAGVQNLLQYIPMVVGPGRMANSVGSFGQQIAQAAQDGYILSIIAPDWRSKSIETDIGHLEGKMGLMPLPAIKPGERRTSTWGGTMLGITKHCKDQDLAWEFARFLYVDKKEDLAKRFEATNIIPPVRAAWGQPEFKEPHPYYGGQKLGLEYAHLAPEVPAQYSSPYVELAKSKYTQALIESVDYYKRNGDKGFEDFVRNSVKAKAAEVRKVMERTRTLQGEAAPAAKEATKQ